jgi:hypothetical protein
MDDLARRIRDAGTQLGGLRGALVAGEPWPLSEHWGTEPEADWGPREILAHLDEMLVFWVEQLKHVLAGDPAVATPFGRVASDPRRLARIEEERRMSSDALLDEIGIGADRAATFAASLSAADGKRRGLHATRGEILVGESIERFLVTHFEEHIDQLRGVLDRRPTG